MLQKNKLNIIIFVFIVGLLLALLLWFTWFIFTYEEEFADSVARLYPPNCSVHGQTFILKRAENFSYESQNKMIPDGAFYYLLPEGNSDAHSFENAHLIKVAQYGDLDLLPWLDQKICIEGDFVQGCPLFSWTPPTCPRKF